MHSQFIKPMTYIHIFAMISILALSFHLVSTFWLPVGCGVMGTLFLAYMFRR